MPTVNKPAMLRRLILRNTTWYQYHVTW